jgi:PHD/YefM family antitoxin component YafN of YafNO toxin-antitoxin module
MTRFETKLVDAASVRVPSVETGSAVVVTRYRKEQVVMLHPEDFHRLAELEASLDDIAAPIEASARSKQLHAQESYAQGPMEDPDALRAFLGL